MKNNTAIKPVIAILFFALFLAFVFDISTGENVSFLFLVICTAVFLLLVKKEIITEPVFLFLTSGSFLKAFYVFYTPVWCRQHDVIDFGAHEGHAAYIEYILSHKSLPDFDPRNVWGFFQPPLHHAICAFWMWVNIRLGIAQDRLHKNVQILPLVYMCLLVFFVYLICKELNMKKTGTAAVMLLVSFHPILIMMSGSINNDALSVMLSVVAIYVAILWHRTPTFGMTALLAASIGFAMTAKLSAALIAPPIGIMMIMKIADDTDRLHDKKKNVSYLLKLILFSVIVFPLGLWWPLRNMIRFSMPPGYIPEVGEQIEKSGFLNRIADVRTASPFLYMKANGFEYDEYNLILTCIKSALFGEGDYASVSPVLTFAGWLLFITAIAAAAVSVAAIIYICFSREAGPDRGIKLLMLLLVISLMGGYAAFALKGNNRAAGDLRYSAAVVAVAGVLTGLCHDRLMILKRKATAYALMTVCAFFAASSVLFYILVGISGT